MSEKVPRAMFWSNLLHVLEALWDAVVLLWAGQVVARHIVFRPPMDAREVQGQGRQHQLNLREDQVDLC